MISEQFIINLSTKWQTSELNVRREYIQHLFLSYFYRHSESDSIFFKGGTALRIIYKSPRFSEDLDFSSTTSTINKLENILLDTIREIEREGIEVDLKESKKTTGGYLAIVDFVVNNHRLAVKIEVSQRKEKNLSEAVSIVNDYIQQYNLIAFKNDHLIKGKIDALLSRHKARDYYDLYFILRANLLTPKDKNRIKDVSKLLENTRINFDKELKLFLPKSHWSIIKNFKDSLRSELIREM